MSLERRGTPEAENTKSEETCQHVHILTPPAQAEGTLAEEGTHEGRMKTKFLSDHKYRFILKFKVQNRIAFFIIADDLSRTPHVLGVGDPHPRVLKGGLVSSVIIFVHQTSNKELQAVDLPVKTFPWRSITENSHDLVPPPQYVNKTNSDSSADRLQVSTGTS